MARHALIRACHPPFARLKNGRPCVDWGVDSTFGLPPANNTRMRAGSPILRRGVGTALAVWLMLLSVASAGLSPVAPCVGQALTAGLTTCGETRACCCRSQTTRKSTCGCEVQEEPAAPEPVKPPVLTVKWLPGIVAKRDVGTIPDTSSRVAAPLERPLAGRTRSVQTLFCIWQD